MGVYVIPDSVTSADITSIPRNSLEFIYHLPSPIRAPQGRQLWVRLKHVRIVNPNALFIKKINGRKRKLHLFVYVEEILRKTNLQSNSAKLLGCAKFGKAGRINRMITCYPCEIDPSPAPLNLCELQSLHIRILDEDGQVPGVLSNNGWASVEMDIFDASTAVSGYPVSCTASLSAGEIISGHKISCRMEQPMFFPEAYEVALSSINTSTSLHLPYEKSLIKLHIGIKKEDEDTIKYKVIPISLDPSLYTSIPHLIEAINKKFLSVANTTDPLSRHAKLIVFRESNPESIEPEPEGYVVIAREHAMDKKSISILISISLHLARILGFSEAVDKFQLEHNIPKRANYKPLPFSLTNMLGDIVRIECDSVVPSMSGNEIVPLLGTVLTQAIDGPSLYTFPNPLMFIPLHGSHINEINFKFSLMNPLTETPQYLPFISKDVNAKVTLNLWFRPIRK